MARARQAAGLSTAEAARRLAQVGPNAIVEAPGPSHLRQFLANFAGLFAQDHHAIDDAVMADMAQHFTAPELVELTMYCGLMLAGGRFAYVMRGWEADDGPVLTGVAVESE